MREVFQRIACGIVRLLALCVCTLAVADSAGAETFGPFSFNPSDPKVIRMDGEFLVGSALDFRRVLAAAPNAELLVLNSPGGVVDIALLVADDVAQRKMSTLIRSGDGCYSACAFVFFAGTERLVEGKLGVHQISSDAPDLKRAQLSISDIIDVLARFETPTEVLTVMFRTPSEQMHVFTPEEITKYRINRKRSDVPPSTPTGLETTDDKVASGPTGDVVPAPLPAEQKPLDQASLDEGSTTLSTVEEYARRPDRMAVYAGLDFFGQDINAIVTADAVGCAQSCLSTGSACKAFTFNVNTQAGRGPNCFLKGATGRADGNRAAISGRLLTRAERDPMPFSMGVIDPVSDLYRNVDLIGDDLYRKPARGVRNPQQCRLACIDNNLCRAFTFVVQKKECWLKRGVGSPRGAAGMISGVKGMQTFSTHSVISLD